MDIADEGAHVFNVGLAKLTGLYQMLDPGTARLGGANVYHAVVASLSAYVCVVSAVLLVSSWYNWTGNMPVGIMYYVLAEFGMHSAYKMWTVARHSDAIWNCLAITRYDFTRYGRSPDKRRELDAWRKRTVRFAAMLSGMYGLTTVFIVVSVLAFRDADTPLTGRDGSISIYRKNIINLSLFVSSDTYNAHYNAYYFVEALVVISITFFFALFDVLLASLCLAICCQLQIVCTAFESIGHCDARSPVGKCLHEFRGISVYHDTYMHCTLIVSVGGEFLLKKVMR